MTKPVHTTNLKSLALISTIAASDKSLTAAEHRALHAQIAESLRNPDAACGWRYREHGVLGFNESVGDGV